MWYFKDKMTNNIIYFLLIKFNIYDNSHWLINTNDNLIKLQKY